MNIILCVPWLARATRTVLALGQLVFEVSTLNDHDADNGIHVVSAETGEPLWSRNFPPGMNHRRQARAMFVEDDLWILELNPNPFCYFYNRANGRDDFVGIYRKLLGKYLFPKPPRFGADQEYRFGKDRPVRPESNPPNPP